MRYVVAVSGGIDSIVLLHLLVATGRHELIVAHFDHGIRPDSAADARFVEALATSYHLPFVGRREELGATASEDQARTRRYHFLRQLARWQQAAIVTAHHGDDVVESIAINLQRGTGWRGVAVLDAEGTARPLLKQTKQTLRAYALRHRLEWVEDSTNDQLLYLRNQLRRVINQRLTADQKQAILGVRQRQLATKQSLLTQAQPFLRADGEYPRHLLTMVDPAVACELLRAMVEHSAQLTPMRPQLQRAVLAIKVNRSGSVHQVGGGLQLRFTKRTFIVETT